MAGTRIKSIFQTVILPVFAPTVVTLTALATLLTSPYHIIFPDKIDPTPRLSACYNQSANRYQPGAWNDRNEGIRLPGTQDHVQSLSNCYAYALNKRIKKIWDRFPQPGIELGPIKISDITKEKIMERVKSDGLIPYDGHGPVPCGYYLVALFINPALVITDFHWYRLDVLEDESIGWTHKSGASVAKDEDWSGNIIRDLSQARLNPLYPVWGGYFLVPQNNKGLS